MKHIIYVTLITAITMLLVFGCNLDGEGAFSSIARATEVEDTDMSDVSVQGIVHANSSEAFVRTASNLLYHDGNEWKPARFDEEMEFSDAVYAGGTYYLSMFNEENVGRSSIYTMSSDPTTGVNTLSTTSTTSLSNVAVRELLTDGTNVITLIDDGGTGQQLSLNGSAPVDFTGDTLQGEIVSKGTFAVNDGTTRLFIRTDEGHTYKSSAPNLEDVTDITADYTGRIVGGASADGRLFLFTYDNNASGDNFSVWDESTPTKLDSVSVSSFSSYSGGLPTVVADTATATVLIGAGSTLLSFDTSSDTLSFVSASEDQFYDAFSSRRITDFYRISDWEFYTATAGAWFYKTTAQGEPSSIQ
ncbi:MAG: hypothetical protein ACQEQU_02585 [Spirochaetota bacterium]